MATKHKVGDIIPLHHHDDFDCDVCERKAAVKKVTGVTNDGTRTPTYQFEYYCKDHAD